MTTAIIGIGRIDGTVARELASAVRVGSVADCHRIEVVDLHAAGGLNGRLVDREEAESLVNKTKSPADRG
jgi:hypothetical protein